jgi:hypothetical protein
MDRKKKQVPPLRCAPVGMTNSLKIPALMRVIRAETLSRSAQALLPRINAGAPTSKDMGSGPGLGTLPRRG